MALLCHPSISDVILSCMYMNVYIVALLCRLSTYYCSDVIRPYMYSYVNGYTVALVVAAWHDFSSSVQRSSSRFLQRGARRRSVGALLRVLRAWPGLAGQRGELTACKWAGAGSFLRGVALAVQLMQPQGH